MDKELVFKLIKWAKRKHPKPMDNESILSKDGRTATIYRENSVFAGLKTFAATPMERHNKVTGSASPFDGTGYTGYYEVATWRPEKYHCHTSSDKRDSAPGVNSTLRLPRS